MLDALAWLGVLEVVGLVAVPIAFAFFRWLPDRGWSLSKPLGILLVSYIWWLLGLTQVIPNTQWTVLGVVMGLGVFSVWLARRQWRELLGFVRAEVWTIVLVEVVVLAFFMGWVLIRAHVPEISHTEQPMDLAFLNSTIRSPSFPPNDPWLSGFSVSYYYFGYLMMGGMTMLSGVGSAVGYNLALATVPALAAAGAFGLVYSLVRMAKGSPDAGAAAGLAAAVLLTVLGNLEGFLEFLRASGLGSLSFWHWVGIEGLSGVASPAAMWYPTDHWWWFRASRVIPGAIAEFPMFSFALGDLHPHVMSIPFLLLAVGGILNVYVSDNPLGLGWLRRHPAQVIGLALMIGALPFINMWDLPTIALLLVGVLALKAYSQASGSLWHLVAVVSPILLLSVVLYFPFYLTFTSQAAGMLPVREQLTPPFHFFLIWGPFLFLSLSFIVLQWRPWNDLRSWRWPMIISASLALLPVALWVLVEVGFRALTGDFEGAPWAIGRRVIQCLPFVTIIAGVGAILMTQAGHEKRGPTPFILLLLAVAYLAIMGPELFFIVDFFGYRVNTVFKLYYQAWILLAVASGYGLYYLHSRWSLSSLGHRVTAWGWWAVAIVIGLAALYYPAATIASRIAESSSTMSLDGLANVARAQPGEYATIRWLVQNAPGDAVVLEAVGNDFSEFGRVSASTGNPTVLGWIDHERQWRGSSLPYKGRPEDVREMYETSDLQRAQELLDRYKVDFVFVGMRERNQYGTTGLAKFDELGTPVVSVGSVVLYRVTR